MPAVTSKQVMDVVAGSNSAYPIIKKLIEAGITSEQVDKMIHYRLIGENLGIYFNENCGGLTRRFLALIDDQGNLDSQFPLDQPSNLSPLSRY